MNPPGERIETDWADVGCSKRSCRYEHSCIWSQCYYAEEPTPDDRCFRWKTVTASDGYLSLVTEEVDHTEMRAEIERAVRQQTIRDLHAGSITTEELAAAGCETRHVVDLRVDGWTTKHPLTCRVDLFACPVNQAAGRDLTEAPGDLGQYACDIDDGGIFRIGDKIVADDSDAQ